MATYYIFNTNIIEKNCTYGQSVDYVIASGGNTKTIKVYGDSSGKARLNISPFIQALFAGETTNSNTAFATSKSFTLDGTSHTAKYGYKGLDESEWASGNTATKYNASSSIEACQVLVRFLDHFGTWRYWAFQRGSHSSTDATAGETLHNNIGTQDIARPQLKTNYKAMNLCSPLVDENTFKFLCDIKNSINVCVKYGASSYMPVNVVSGTSTWVVDDKRQQLQDFEITIQYPTNSISL